MLMFFCAFNTPNYLNFVAKLDVSGRLPIVMTALMQIGMAVGQAAIASLSGANDFLTPFFRRDDRNSRMGDRYPHHQASEQSDGWQRDIGKRSRVSIDYGLNRYATNLMTAVRQACASAPVGGRESATASPTTGKIHGQAESDGLGHAAAQACRAMEKGGLFYCGPASSSRRSSLAPFLCSNWMRRLSPRHCPRSPRPCINLPCGFI
jgi:hypothetical protein